MSQLSTGAKVAIGVVGALAVAGIVAAIVIEKKKKDEKLIPTNPPMTPTNPPSSLAAAPQHSNYAVESSPVSPSSLTPDLRTESDGNSLYDMNGRSPTGAQPIEADYSSGMFRRQDAPDDQWAPVDMMSSNDALSLANPDNAQWFSQNLLPNAELSCSNDGMVTEGPSFEELAIFTPRLLEASVASRFFQEPPQLRSRCGGSDIRPTPLIPASAGSRESIPWAISSLQMSDVALDNAARIRAFCT